MKKNIKKVHQYGGGAIHGEMKDFIAISFDDNTSVSIENNGKDSIKKQVNDYMKTLNKTDDTTK